MIGWFERKKDIADGWGTEDDKPLNVVPSVAVLPVPQVVKEPLVITESPVKASLPAQHNLDAPEEIDTPAEVIEPLDAETECIFRSLNTAANQPEKDSDETKVVHSVEAHGYSVVVLQKGKDFRATTKFHGGGRVFICYGDSLVAVLGQAQTHGQQNLRQDDLNARRAPGDVVSNSNPAMDVTFREQKT